MSTFNKTLSQVTADIIHPLTERPGKLWYMGIFLAIIAFLFGVIFTYNTIWFGIGEWGVNSTVGWGWAIVNFVWWIGIGHAGTFISAILLLFEQRWRTSINRAAEAMTIIAIMCAAFFPIIHVGRVLLAYFILPYPNTRNTWVNFSSPLQWDVFAIFTYFLISLIFWYIGLIPDLALVRDHAPGGFRKKVYRFLSLGWTGSMNQWSNFTRTSLVLAGIATPLVVSVHSIVSMDFATSIIPGWHSTIFPPYFVAGALLSGFAMVLILMIVARKVLHLEDYISVKHIESMNKIVIVTSTIVALAYMTEMFFAFYSGHEFELYMMQNRMTGTYAVFFWLMLLFNMLVPQLLWIRKLRRNITVTFIFSLLINTGMWIERFVIVVGSLHQDFVPSSWSLYSPTIADVALFIGSLGFFFLFFLLLIRIFPVISIAEIKADMNNHLEDD